MQLTRQTRLLAALLLWLAPSLRAQLPADPSGHWEGSIQAPDRDVKIEVDLAKNRKGEIAGTIGIPAQNLKGLPLLKVAVEGRSIAFYARVDQPITGVLSGDGKSMSGELSVSGSSVHVSLTRTGDARVEAPVKSAPIGKELEGTWNAGCRRQAVSARLDVVESTRRDGHRQYCQPG